MLKRNVALLFLLAFLLVATSCSENNESLTVKDSVQKFYTIQCVCKEFLEQIENPGDITKLYVLDFYESSDEIKILYTINNKDYIANFSLEEHRHYKPIPIGETETGTYYDDAYKNQFIKCAYKMDLTYISSPTILVFPSAEINSLDTANYGQKQVE